MWSEDGPISESAAESGFDSALAVCFEDLELTLTSMGDAPWSDFLLNPRRLRGSDFLMRWSQGVWSEQRLIDAVNATERYRALPYGPSGVAPSDDIRAFELYFERLEAAGLGQIERPDLLVFQTDDWAQASAIVSRLGGEAELPFALEESPDIKALLRLAVVAVECENSLWKGKMMPDYGSELRPQKRLDWKEGLRKAAVLPTIIVKEEDRLPLRGWQAANRVPIHVWHVFFDMAFGIALDRIEGLIEGGLIQPTVQTFQAPGGATTSKVIHKIYYHYAYPLGEATSDPTLIPDFIEEKNGHILPYVRFEGGTLVFTIEALRVLDELAAR
ncbi:MAG: AccI family restriction endonuclease [Acidobacteria bacterium]|nr:AccI family restriction endonuclease [Acidobacteriota bacterium]